MRSVHGLARAQAAAGDRVTVFTTNVDGPDELNVPLARAVRLDGIEVWYFPVVSPRRLARSPAMTRELHGAIASFDIVHLHSVFLWPTQAVARACCRAGVPYVLSPRGMLVRDLIAARGRLRKTLWLALFERRTVRDAAAVVVSSELEAGELRRSTSGPRTWRWCPTGCRGKTQLRTAARTMPHLRCCGPTDARSCSTSAV